MTFNKVHALHIHVLHKYILLLLFLLLYCICHFREDSVRIPKILMMPTGKK